MAGAAGSNECPAGSARIVTADACRTAVAATGKNFNNGVVTSSSDPRGCMFSTQLVTLAYFNADAVGKGNAYAQLLCAAAASAGAPAQRRLSASAYPVSTLEYPRRPSAAVRVHDRTARAAAAAARRVGMGTSSVRVLAPRR